MFPKKRIILAPIIANKIFFNKVKLSATNTTASLTAFIAPTKPSLKSLANCAISTWFSSIVVLRSEKCAVKLEKKPASLTVL